jgi:hypothetical protein
MNARSIVRELVQSVVEQDKDKKPATPRPIKGGLQGHYKAGLGDAWKKKPRRSFDNKYDPMNAASYHHGYDIGLRGEK